MKKKTAPFKRREMALKYLSLLIVLTFVLAGCQPTPPPQQTTITKNAVVFDYLADQKIVDQNLQKEVEKGYTISDPFIAVNPYSNSPLSAVVIFNTSTTTSVKLTVKGHDSYNDISTSFSSNTKHILPIYGLYQGESNNVELILSDGTKKSLSIITDKIVSDVVKLKVNKFDKSQYNNNGLYFVMPDSTGADKIHLSAYDSNGDMRWVLIGSAPGLLKRLKNGRMLVSTMEKMSTQKNFTGVREIDLMGKTYSHFLIPGGVHHDTIELPNGNIIVTSSDPTFKTIDDFVVEIDRTTGEVVKTIKMSDYITPYDGGSALKLLGDTIYPPNDWFHNNSLDYDVATDTLIISGRHVDAVVGIDYSKNELKWLLGNPEGWINTPKSKFFKPVGTPFEWQYAQHSAILIPNGDIFLFDNGISRTKATSPSKALKDNKIYSRAVIYKTNTKNMTVSQVWQYGKERGASWSSAYAGNAQYLAKNQYLITSGGIIKNAETGFYGVLLKNATATSVFSSFIDEVKNNKLIFELELPKNSYRAFKYPIYTKKNTYDIYSEGKYFGDLGKTVFLSGITISNASQLTNVSNMNLTKEFGRVVLNGTWSGTAPIKAVFALKNITTSEIIAINIPTASKTNGFLAWISDIELSGEYEAYILIDNKAYSTGYKVTY